MPDTARAPTIIYNTRQISLKHKTETEDFSCPAFSANLFNFSLCVGLLSFLNGAIRVYLQMGDTWINVAKRFNKCDEYCSYFWRHDSFEERELSIESSLFTFRYDVWLFNYNH